MSICPYNKNTKNNPISTPTNASNKSLKDERPGSHHPSKGSARRQQQGHFDGKKNNSRHWKHQRVDCQRKEGRFEKYAPGGSYVSVDGTVKDGSKKVSLNHLLNFKFEPRHYEDTRYSDWFASKPSRNRTSSCSAYNKERFLQANSRFLTKKGEDYSIHATDPDAAIPWEYVEKVLLQVNDDVTCPICLYPPTVPKITRCGHVYCWPCILHYLALDEKGKSVRDCPICAVNVRKADLRSVSFLETQPLLVGTVLKMNLMAREASSLSPKPIADVGDDLFHYESAKVVEYSPAQVLECIVEPEIEMLKVKLSLEVDEFEKQFLNCALADCEVRKVDLLIEISCVSDKAPNLGGRSTSVNNKLNAEQATSTCANSLDQTIYYYFYQIEGGGYVFLDGLNVKCLLKEYSHFKECPTAIEASAAHVETFVMTEELRKRHKYLSHLPLSCEYKIVELDLRPPLVSRETLDGFGTLIQQRRQSRQKKERQENEARKRADIAEARKWRESVRGAAFLSEDSVVVSASIQIEGAAKSLSSVGSYSSDMSLSPPGQIPGSMSFAEKLRCSQGNTSSAWPQKVTTKQNVPSHSGVGINRDEDDDPYYHAPAFQSSFGDALTAALDNMQCTSSDTVAAESGVAPKGRKAKKKKKQTLLFSTSAHMRP